MERFLPIAYIVGWFGFIFGASYLINWLLVRSVIRQVYRVFVAPGVVVHEISHAVGCLATGAHIEEINFWKSSGGHVKHHHPKVPLFGEAIIALAPIGGTFFLLAFLTWLMIPNLYSLLRLEQPSSALSSINWTSWQTWLYFYLVTSLTATIAPSKTDMRYALGSLVVVALLLVFLLVMFPDFSGTLSNLGRLIQPFVFFASVLLAVAIFVAFVLFLPNRDKHFVARSQIE